jgi:hypothetical protein
MIAAVVLSSTAGEVLTAAAMKSVGDLDEIRAHSGPEGRYSSRPYLPSLFCRSLFSGAGLLLATLRSQPPEPLSLVGPAAASLTVITNAIAAKLFLQRERGSPPVDLSRH